MRFLSVLILLAVFTACLSIGSNPAFGNPELPETTESTAGATESPRPDLSPEWTETPHPESSRPSETFGEPLPMIVPAWEDQSLSTDGTSPHEAIDQPEASPEQEREVRDSSLPEGVYFMRRGNSSLVTRNTPYLSVTASEEEIRDFFQNSDMRDIQVVVRYPSLRGYQETVDKLNRVLQELGLPGDVRVFREPSGFLEGARARFPLPEDYEQSTLGERVQARVILGSAVGISFGVFTWLAMLNHISIETAQAMVGIAGVNTLLSAYPLRGWSNYFDRIKLTDRVIFNTIYTAIIITGPTAIAMNGSLPIGQALITTVFVAGASAIISSAVFAWEHAKFHEESIDGLPLDLRRTLRSSIVMGLHFMMVPFYVAALATDAGISWLDAVNSVFDGVNAFTGGAIDINIGRVGLFTIAAGASIPYIYSESFAELTTRMLRSRTARGLGRAWQTTKATCHNFVSLLGKIAL